MVAAGDPLQGQARRGQACLPPSRVTASAATTAASSSPEATAPLKADLAPTPLMRALLRHIAEAGRARVGLGGARAPGVVTRDLHLARCRRRPPAHMLSLVLVGLRLEQQFRFSTRSSPELTWACRMRLLWRKQRIWGEGFHQGSRQVLQGHHREAVARRHLPEGQPAGHRPRSRGWLHALPQPGPHRQPREAPGDGVILV